VATGGPTQPLHPAVHVEPERPGELETVSMAVRSARDAPVARVMGLEVRDLGHD
jgi:hypothetical protein